VVQDEPRTTDLSSPLILLTAVLMAVGLVMVTSSTAPVDRSMLDGPWWRSPVGRQGMFVLAGLAIMAITARLGCAALSWASFRRVVPPAVFVILAVLLAATLIPGIGDERRGSHRWLVLAPAWTGLSFQPSELAKLTLVMLLAWLLGERGTDPRSFRSAFLPASAAIGGYVLLVGTANFGTAALLAGVGGMMLLVAGCCWRHLFLLGSLGGCGMAGLLYAAPYRLARLAAYRDIWAEPRGAGYQPLQSLATIASGGWLGKGLGAGVQKYGYLPDSHSDFIFSVLCEEAGFLGGVVVIAMFCGLTWLGMRVMAQARSPLERLLAFGLTATIGLQAVMNIAVVTVMAPTTGISLPLVSAGGSGLMAFSFSVGLLGAIAHRNAGGEVVEHRSDLPARGRSLLRIGERFAW